MPRFFFNIRDGFDLDEDEEGIELPDFEAAKAEALATVEELRDQLQDAGQIALEIADETGRRLLTVPFFLDTGAGGEDRPRRQWLSAETTARRVRRPTSSA